MPPSDPQPAPRFEEPVFEALTPRQTEVWRRMADGPRGKLPTPYRIWISSPEVADKFEQLGLHLLRNGAFTTREIEIAILTSAVYAKAAFVLSAHLGIARRAGLPEDVIAALAQGEPPALPDPREAMVYALTGALIRHQPVSDELFAQARETLGHAALAELTALLGYYAAVQMVTTLYAAQPQSTGGQG